jgi:hypothetical protein
MDLPEFRALSTISEEADQVSIDYLGTHNDWHLYKSNIERTGDERPDPGKASELGIFTLARYQSLMKGFIISLDIEPLIKLSMEEERSGLRRSSLLFNLWLRVNTLDLKPLNSILGQ